MKKDFIYMLESFLYKYRLVAWVVVGAALLAVPLLGFSLFIMRMFIMIGIFAILALGLNLLTGYAGQVSLGHAGFFAIGAYTYTLMKINLDAPFLVAMVVAMAISAGCGVLLGLPTLRLSGNYLTIVTLGFGEIVRMVIINWRSLTRGPLGIGGIPAPELFGTTFTLGNHGFYYAMLVMLLCTGLVCYAVVNSRTGRAFKAIKQDPIAATMMGIRTTRFKVLAFVLSALITGAAGAFYAPIIGFIDHNTFSFDISVLILTVVIVGGMGTMRGMFLGAIIIIAFPEVARFLMTYRFVVYGLLLIVMMRFRPQGLLGWKGRLPYKIPKAAQQKLETGA